MYNNIKNPTHYYHIKQTEIQRLQLYLRILGAVLGATVGFLIVMLKWLW